MDRKAFFGNLFSREAEKSRTAAERWTALVAQLADGKLPNAADAERLLVECVKTPAGLQADVDCLVRRRAARTAMDRARTIAQERAALESAAQKAQRDHAAAVAAADSGLDRALAPIRVKAAELDQAEKAAADGEALLRATHGRDDVAGEITRLQRDAGDLRERARQLDEKAKRATDFANGSWARPGADGSNAGPISPEENRKAAADCSAGAERFRAEAAGLERQAAALDAKLLDP